MKRSMKYPHLFLLVCKVYGIQRFATISLLLLHLENNSLQSEIFAKQIKN